MLLRRLIKSIIFSNYHKNIRNYSLFYRAKYKNSLVTSSHYLKINSDRFELKKLISSSSSSEGQQGNGESINEFDAIEEFSEQNIITESPDIKSFCLKNILYSNLNSNDPLMLEINDCRTSDEIFKVFLDKKNDFQVHHTVQSVILLWNLKRNTENSESFDNNAIICSKNFENFLEILNKFIDKMNHDELTCCFLYLNKFGVDISNYTMRKLLQEILDKISDFNADIPLTALSRLTVAVNTCQDLYTFLVCKDVLPHIIKWIEKCKNAEELRLITISMFHLHQMISKDVIELYKEKVSNLLDDGVINNQSVKCVLKIINFLNFPHWSNDCSQLVRRLALILDNQNDENLSQKEIETMFKLFLSHLEPASYIPKLSKLSEQYFKQNPTPELLACAVHFSQPTKRNELISIAREMIENSNLYSQPNAILSFFIILRSLKISDINLCNTYWTNILKLIENNQNERINYKLIRHCYRYMHFNNNLGGTYRHKLFETKINEILLNELKNGISSFIPTKFAKLSSFLLAYGYKTNKNTIPNIIIDKIEDMCEQFTVSDCLQLSRALQIAFEMRYRHFLPLELAEQFHRVENVLNTCAERHLSGDINLINLNFIIRSLTNRKAPRKTHLYKMAIEKYKTIENHMNSRSIRETSFNLISSGYLVPEIIEKMLNYLIKNKEYITGDTVEKIISCCYNLGYIPKNDDALHWSSEIIQRDFEFMSGLSIVQACLALCFYKILPESLINRIFNIEFIRRLEEEIQSCYSKATYPERVLNQVMQLNRAVCLDFPESQVPWFQQNYIEAQMSKKPVIQTRFHKEIMKMLISVLEEEKFIRCNHVTPYGYTIDFVIHLDKNRKPILPPKESVILNRITKVAILLLRLDSFCQNDNKTMRGHEHLRMRHLEMLGYKVIHINLSDWNSMYMNVPGAKMNYLKGLLQIE